VNRFSVAIPVICVALLAGCACPPRVDRSTDEPGRAARPAVAMRVAAVTLEDRPVSALAVGVLHARRRSVIAARLSARVLAVAVREGDLIREGQELFRLDDRDPTAGTASARAAVREAQHALEEAARARAGADRTVEAASAQERLARLTRGRLSTLFDTGGVSAQQRDEAVSRADAAAAELARSREAAASARARRAEMDGRLAQARAEADRAAVGRTDTVIAAPFDGVVASRPVDPGTMATPGLPLVTVEDGHPRLECLVPESWVHLLKPGDPAALELDAPPGRVAGIVEELTPTSDTSSHTVLVRVALPPGATGRSGTFGRARFRIGSRPAIVVPAGAVLPRGQLELAFVLDAAGAARLRLVKTGEQDGEHLEVLSGLDPGERVLVGDLTRLADGAAVEVLR